MKNEANYIMPSEFFFILQRNELYVLDIIHKISLYLLFSLQAEPFHVSFYLFETKWNLFTAPISREKRQAANHPSDPNFSTIKWRHLSVCSIPTHSVTARHQHHPPSLPGKTHLPRVGASFNNNLTIMLTQPQTGDRLDRCSGKFYRQCRLAHSVFGIFGWAPPPSLVYIGSSFHPSSPSLAAKPYDISTSWVSRPVHDGPECDDRRTRRFGCLCLCLCVGKATNRCVAV